jgi:hypothetical protein
MKRKDLKEIIRQIVRDLSEDAGAAPANTTANVSGYDGPFGPVLKRKPKKPKLTEEDEEG